jgi:hypothetical protein
MLCFDLFVLFVLQEMEKILLQAQEKRVVNLALHLRSKLDGVVKGSQTMEAFKEEITKEAQALCAVSRE